MTDETGEFKERRGRMVAEQIAARGVEDERVLEAMREVPRERFVPEDKRGEAFADGPLPIGEGQTISQPYIVAYMTEQLRLRGGERVLEIGSGCGYQTAVLARLCGRVCAIEYFPELAARARRVWEELGIGNVDLRVGDGRLGWPEEAPFDAVLVAAAAPAMPSALVDQMAPGGRMIIPIGADSQSLVRVEKTPGGIREERLLGVRFVPFFEVGSA